jgi:hypothetical protein
MGNPSLHANCEQLPVTYGVGDGDGDGDVVSPPAGASGGAELVSTNVRPPNTPTVSDPDSAVSSTPRAVDAESPTVETSTRRPSRVCNSLSVLMTSSYLPVTVNVTGIP